MYNYYLSDNLYICINDIVWSDYKYVTIFGSSLSILLRCVKQNHLHHTLPAPIQQETKDVFTENNTKKDIRKVRKDVSENVIFQNF